MEEVAVVISPSARLREPNIEEHPAVESAAIRLSSQPTIAASYPFGALNCWLGDWKGIRLVKNSSVLVCWW